MADRRRQRSLAAPQINKTEPSTPAVAQCAPYMAPITGRRYLTCFYCGRRSDKRYEGLVRRWECRRCEGENFLDENGEITDPPVATWDVAPPKVQFAQSFDRPVSPSPSSLDPSSIFCSTCLKNQHLFTASLAQYFPDADDDLDSKPLDKNYYKFRQDLEQRYPQVCDECEPKVHDRMRQAGYAAKTDHLRRLIEQTRASRSSRRRSPRSLTLLYVFQALGQALWWAGLLGQLGWNIYGIFGGSMQGVLYTLGSAFGIVSAFLTSWVPDWISRYLPSFQLSQELLDSSPLIPELTMADAVHYPSPLAKWSLVISLVAMYWNPKFKEACRGFTGHISGFLDWYKYQVISIGARLMVWMLMGHGVFANPTAGPSRAVHLLMTVFLTAIAYASHRSIKISLSPLFASSPEKLKPYVKPKPKPQNGEPRSMYQALDDILLETPHHSRDVVARSRSPSGSPTPPLHQQGKNRWRSPPRRDTPETPQFGRNLPPRTTPSLSRMSGRDAMKYMKTGEVGSGMIDDGDSMDWSPTQPKYRAFDPGRGPASLRSTESFNRAPVKPEQEASPFWYKVPAAPTAPAHKLRNPPNQPRLNPTSEERKQNFFQRVTRSSAKPPSRGENEDEGTPQTSRERVNMEFAAPRFFPPETADSSNALAEMMNKSFTLKDEPEQEREASSSAEQLVQTVGLIPLCAFMVVFLAIAGGIATKSFYEHGIGGLGTGL